jgi:hypothetical protein
VGAAGTKSGIVSCVDGALLARGYLDIDAAWSGAVMCSACWCGAHGRWP